MSEMVKVVGVERRYGSNGAVVRAVDGVDLVMQAGEFVSVMGPSGCGKSTLLNILGGLERPTGGEVWIGGERIDQMSEAALAKLRRRRIGFVFQFFNLLGNMTVADNIELAGLVAGHSAGDARKRSEGLLEELGISDKAKDVPARLSGGQRQRVALARALINDPDVLLADEPTGNLDSSNATEVLGLLREFHRKGQTIVLVTHDPRVATRADRLLTMRDGRMVDETALTDGIAGRALFDLLDVEQ